MLTRRAFTLAAAAAPLLAQRNRLIRDFFDRFTDDWVRNDPSLATALRYFSGAEQDRLDRRLTPVTRAHTLETIARARAGLRQLRSFDRNAMTPAEQLAAQVMEWQLEAVVRSEPYLDYEFPLQQMNGVNVNLVEMFTVRRPLAREADAESYAAALEQVDDRMEEAVERSRQLAGRDILPPRFILDATLRQLRSFIDPPPAQNPFVTAFAEKTAGIAALPAARRSALLEQVRNIVAQKVYPAWRKAIAELESQVPRSAGDAGLWRLKGGEDAYAYFLWRYTTTNRTAEEIHQIGLDQVARLEAQMDGLLRKLGRTEGSVKDRIAQLQLDLRYPDPASEASRARIIEDMAAILEDAQRRAETLFDVRPKAPVQVQPFPAFREANAAANYNAPAPDGSRPGVIQFPRRIERMTRFGLRTLVYHEGVPGHHFQIALQVENRELPRFMQLRALGGISASTEGWALYAERLAAESGWYDGDPEGLLGQLADELWRARRLVVDTGLHAKRWTRQQAIDYGIEASEVERYVVYPGQACSYMMGQLKILELREKARAALGAKFSLRQFHNAVLACGSAPLEVLEKQVDQYIDATLRL